MRNRKPKVTSLKDLIDKIDWVKIEGHQRGMVKMPFDQISVGFYPKVATSSVVDEVRLRLGFEVLKNLNWSPKDKLLLLYNPDDVDTFLVVKSDNGVGWLLSEEKGGGAIVVFISNGT